MGQEQVPLVQGAASSAHLEEGRPSAAAAQLPQAHVRTPCGPNRVAGREFTVREAYLHYHTVHLVCVIDPCMCWMLHAIDCAITCVCARQSVVSVLAFL